VRLRCITKGFGSAWQFCLLRRCGANGESQKPAGQVPAENSGVLKMKFLRKMLVDCAEQDIVRMDGQQWRVGGVEHGNITLYGITRYSIKCVPGTTVVEIPEFQSHG
jgi:hypothetical protein